MEKELAHGPIGQDGSYDVEFKDGKFMVSAMYSKSDLGAEAKVSIMISADMVLDAIAKAIPGKIDDAVLNLIKLALKV